MIKEIIKYCDLFGTRFHFYTDEMPKHYTILGGISSILLLLVCSLSFISYYFDDFKRVTPTVTTSSMPSAGYHNIKFSKEKIWLPWRIVDYQNKYVDHKGLVHPIIYYNSATRKDLKQSFDLNTTKLNYVLCNETSMIHKPNIYLIDVPLDHLYCINMENLYIGGSWNALFINYIKMDFYLCEDGIEYDESNPKCTTKEQIKKKIGENNSLVIQFYYPLVQFQPTNITDPIILFYKQYLYHISKFSNKIARLYLQQYKLSDDLGWFNKKINKTSYWGYSRLIGDSYTGIYPNDLIKESSTSRSYTLNIYLEPGTTYYERKYKKFYQIILESIPLLYIIGFIFNKVVKLFKLAEENKKFVELLFENLNVKKNKFKKFKEKIIQKQLKSKQNNLKNCVTVFKEDKGLNFHPEIISGINVAKDSYIKEYSKDIFLSDPFKNQILNKYKENSLDIINRSKSKENKLNIFNSPSRLKRRLEKNFESPKKSNSNNASGIVDNIQNNVKNILKVYSFNNKSYKISKLFPYRYYFFSIFVKNIDVSKCNNMFLSIKFLKVYQFLSKLIDISSYLVLLREFQILKSTLLKSEEINLIERANKINVNERAFMRNMNECIERGRFQIFSQNITQNRK